MEMQQNTSGQGSAAIVPEEIKGWNWGAFLLGWVWSIGNSVWIGLLTLIFGWIMAIILGVKGSEWAWQNRKWESVEQFKTVQKTWAKWGVIVLIISVVIGCIWAFAVSMAAREAWKMPASVPMPVTPSR